MISSRLFRIFHFHFSPGCHLVYSMTLMNCTIYFLTQVTSTHSIGLIRILGIGLELAWNGGSCGGISLKREQCHILSIVREQAILGDPGATIRDNAISAGESSYFKSWRAPGNLFLPNQFQKGSNFVPLIGQKNIFSVQTAMRSSWVTLPPSYRK